MNVLIRFGMVFLFASIIAGCSKNDASSIAASHSDLFPAGQLKENWNAAMTAMQTNGYVAAMNALNKCRAENPNLNQLNAINDTVRKLNDQMIAAAEKGDINASNALKQIMNQSR